MWSYQYFVYRRSDFKCDIFSNTLYVLGFTFSKQFREYFQRILFIFYLQLTIQRALPPVRLRKRKRVPFYFDVAERRLTRDSACFADSKIFNTDSSSYSIRLRVSVISAATVKCDDIEHFILDGRLVLRRDIREIPT